MQLETVRREVSSSGTMQVAKATIKATPKIFDMFANDTYANKPLAIMRELVANGIDAQRTVNPNRPVEVQLPTPLDPTCRIRDFGIGMAHDFVMGPFMAYTDGSTKDKSDDDIGGFGIGSKSPFAYVDQYTLRVVHDGVLSVYTMFKDEDGIPAIGLQAQTTTDEPNGVEVSFPVEDADMQTFAEAAQEALQYFRPLPLVVNGTLNPPDYTYVGNNWSMRAKAGPLGVIMGGVRYPVTTASLDSSLRFDSKLKPLLEYGLDLILPLGSCGIAMSREQLSYVPKTSTNIAKALAAVVDDVVATFATFFDSCPSEWDAMALLSKETGMDSYSRSGRQQLLMANAKYKGQKLETNFRIEPQDFPRVGLRADEVQGWRIEPQRSRRSSNCPSPKWQSMVELYSISPAEIEQVIIDDLPQSPKSKTIQRIKEHVSSAVQAKKILIVRGRDEHQVTKLTLLLRGPTQVILTSSLPEPAPRAKAAKNVRPKVRMFTFNGNKDRFTHSPIFNLTPSTSKDQAVAEVPYADQPATGIMVVMNSFDLPHDFHRKMATGLVAYSELHFVNATDEPKIKAMFRNFNDVFDDRLAKALAAYPDLPQALALSNNSRMLKYTEAFGHIYRDKRFLDLPAAAHQRPFGRMCAAWQRYVVPLTEAQRKLASFVDPVLPAGVDPKALDEAIESKQPQAVILMQNLSMSSFDHRAILFDYL